MNVRILHVADVHLGAPLGNFGDYAARRREDLEAAFRRTVGVALAERVHAVLVAGDLFDSHRPEPRIVELARRELARLREAGIPVLVVPGTHDTLLQPDCVYRREDLPIDRLFDAPSFAGPERIDADGTQVWIYGIAADPRRPGGWKTLARASTEGLHVALVHAACRDRLDWAIPPGDLPFDPADLPDTGMDYVALGHYHNERVFEGPDGRVLAAYPGSVEGRDWTETGPRGALLVEWTDGARGPTLQSVPVHSRVLESSELDVSGAASEAEVRDRIRARFPPESLWRIELVGEPEIVLRPESIAADLEAHYGYVQVVDGTTVVTSRRVAELCDERTVRGEFFRRLVAERDGASRDRDRRVADRALKLGMRVLG